MIVEVLGRLSPHCIPVRGCGTVVVVKDAAADVSEVVEPGCVSRRAMFQDVNASIEVDGEGGGIQQVAGYDA